MFCFNVEMQTECTITVNTAQSVSLVLRRTESTTAILERSLDDIKPILISTDIGIPDDYVVHIDLSAIGTTHPLRFSYAVDNKNTPTVENSTTQYGGAINSLQRTLDEQNLNKFVEEKGLLRSPTFLSVVGSATIQTILLFSRFDNILRLVGVVIVIDAPSVHKHISNNEADGKLYIQLAESEVVHRKLKAAIVKRFDPTGQRKLGYKFQPIVVVKGFATHYSQ